MALFDAFPFFRFVVGVPLAVWLLCALSPGVFIAVFQLGAPLSGCVHCLLAVVQFLAQMHGLHVYWIMYSTH